MTGAVSRLSSLLATLGGAASVLGAGDTAVLRPTATAAASESAAVAGTAIARIRRAVTRRCGGVRVVMAATRSRRTGGAAGVSLKSAAVSSGDKLRSHLLLAPLERAGEARRAGRGTDPEDASGVRRIQIEDDAERDDLAIGGREARERLPEPGGEDLRVQLA